MSINPVELAERTQLFSEHYAGTVPVFLPNPREFEAAISELVEAGIPPKLIGATTLGAGGAMLGLLGSQLVSPGESPTDAVVAGGVIGAGLGLLLF